MSPPRVALIVDHPQRDLPGLALVAARLCRDGVECHLVPLNRQERDLWAIAPDLVLLNFTRRGNERLAARLVAAGIRLAVLDTEGGVWPDPQSYTSLLWNDAALRRQVGAMMMWGPALARHVVEDGWFAADQVVVTGCPRFDFYHPRWRRVLEAAPRASAAPPRILVNTNFYTVNSRFVDVERNRAQLCSELGWSPEQAEELVRRELSAREAFGDLVIELAGELPAAVVLRPHPFEDPAWYRARFAGARGVSVEPDGPVQSALFAARALVQRSCTTALEAALAGIPAFSPQWIPAPSLMPMAEAVSVPASDADALVTVLRTVLAGEWSAPPAADAAARRTIRAWFFRADGRAFLRVAHAIMQLLPRRRVVDTAACRRELYGLSGEDPGLAAAGRWMRHRLRLSPDWSFRRMRTVRPALYADKQLRDAEVAALVGRIGEAAPPLHAAGLRLDRGSAGPGPAAHSLRLRRPAAARVRHG